MPVPIKLTPAQHDKLMNHPVHYNVHFSYREKENMFEGDVDPSDLKIIKSLVDEPIRNVEVVTDEQPEKAKDDAGDLPQGGE